MLQVGSLSRRIRCQISRLISFCGVDLLGNNGLPLNCFSVREVETEWGETAKGRRKNKCPILVGFSAVQDRGQIE